MKLLLTLRHVKCEKCGAKYKVEAKSMILFASIIGIAVFSAPYVKVIFPENLKWVSYILIILTVFVVAPFNQRLELVDENS